MRFLARLPRHTRTHTELSNLLWLSENLWSTASPDPQTQDYTWAARKPGELWKKKEKEKKKGNMKSCEFYEWKLGL